MDESTRQTKLYEFREEFLRRRRKDILGFSQAYVAKKIGVSQSNYSRYESGELEPDRQIASAIADILQFDAKTRSVWLSLLFNTSTMMNVSPNEMLKTYHLSIGTSESAHREFLHIDPAKREEVLVRAAHILNSWAPVETQRLWKLQRIKSFAEFDSKIYGLDTYIDHETDHAVMLILEWMKEGDSERWRNLVDNLDRFVDVVYWNARAERLNLENARALNTLLCYAHRFGPPALSEKVMNYTLKLADGHENDVSDYILRDVLHCDVFRAAPTGEQRLYDFLKDTFKATRDGAGGTTEPICPGSEILYFAPSVWEYQAPFLRNHLLPDPLGIKRADLAKVLKQTLEHMDGHDLPPLSVANYALACLKLLDAHQKSSGSLLSWDIVETMIRVADVPTENAIHGMPVIHDIWSEMVIQFERLAEAWNYFQGELQTHLNERWN